MTVTKCPWCDCDVSEGPAECCGDDCDNEIEDYNRSTLIGELGSEDV